MVSAQALPHRLIGPSRESREAVARATKVLEPVAEVGYWYTEYVRLHSDRIALDLDLVRALADGPILDVGTSPPVLLQALTDLGADAYGVDLDPGRFPGELGIERCDIEHEPLPFPDDRFSVVNFNEIFEHLRINPAFPVREVARVLRPDGHLLMSTPNARSFAGIVNFLRHRRVGWCETNIYRQYAKLDTLGHMGHVREYTAVEVVEFLHDLRFKVEHIVWRGSLDDMPGHRIDRRVHSLAPFMTVIARPPG